ncbi:alpha-amylase family glycosyl hydrolase [Granulicella arctica]|uniref:alpha-amylase family glycosyl hydrolase n=1 Tax=Granulicella arctica TaxID=940613 RepID=UPI0021E05897|nr:alpha-amylase family glycosyl hydrolase [Granulicella arctica]
MPNFSLYPIRIDLSLQSATITPVINSVENGTPTAENTAALRVLKTSSRAFSVLLFLLLACLLAGPGVGQTLARPGWAGSGMNLEAWWTHAIFYEVDPHGFRDADGNGIGDLRGLTSQLDYIHSLGVDAITVTHVAPAQGEIPARLQSIDPAVGSLDDFDDLIREASRDSLRLIVQLDVPQGTDPAALATIAKFWLSRGAAGISVRSGTPGDPSRAAQLHRLHEVTRSFAGQRILIAESSSTGSAAIPHADIDMVLDPALAQVGGADAGKLRTAMESLQAASANLALIAATDGPESDRSAGRIGDGTNNQAIAKVLATLLLSTRANAQLYFGQEIGFAAKAGDSALIPWGVPADPNAKPSAKTASQGPEVIAEEADPDSLLNWYRRLIDLHHGNAILRSGASDLLNHDDQNSIVWISRKATITPLTPAIVVACNLSSKPVTLSLTGDIAKLHLRGNFLRTVIRSDNGMGGMSLNAITLPPFGVYIGEIRF